MPVIPASFTDAPGGYLPGGEVLPDRKLKSAVYRCYRRGQLAARAARGCGNSMVEPYRPSDPGRPPVFLNTLGVLRDRTALPTMPDLLRQRVHEFACNRLSMPRFTRGGREVNVCSPFRYIAAYVAGFSYRDLDDNQ